MKATHTPGPWMVRGGVVVADLVIDQPRICRVFYQDDAIEECANADLICAAPVLLEALKEMQRTEMFFPDHPQKHAAYRMALAAIAKAEGRRG